MVDLGKYAFVVLASYGVTLTLLVAVVGYYLTRNIRSKRELELAEASINAT